MARSQVDFRVPFRRLSDAALGPDHDGGVRQLFADPAAYDEWAARWRQRLGGEPEDSKQDSRARRTAMRAVNPAFISRNHPGEAGSEGALNPDGFVPFEELLAVPSKPYEDQPAV